MESTTKLEVAFIVLTFGTTQGSIPLAALGAGIALVLVVIVGALVHQPLSRVPENTMKFAVGLMLATFGIFWSVEGTGLVKNIPLREANGSHGRQRYLPNVWIEPVQEKWSYPPWQTKSSL